MATVVHRLAPFSLIITALLRHWATVVVLPAFPSAMSAATVLPVPTVPPITHTTALIIPVLLIAQSSHNAPPATIQRSLIVLPAIRGITSLQGRLKAVTLSVETESEYLLRDVTTITTQMEMAVRLPAQSKVTISVSIPFPIPVFVTLVFPSARIVAVILPAPPVRQTMPTTTQRMRVLLTAQLWHYAPLVIITSIIHAALPVRLVIQLIIAQTLAKLNATMGLK